MLIIREAQLLPETNNLKAEFPLPLAFPSLWQLMSLLLSESEFRLQWPFVFEQKGTLTSVNMCGSQSLLKSPYSRQSSSTYMRLAISTLIKQSHVHHQSSVFERKQT